MIKYTYTPAAPTPEELERYRYGRVFQQLARKDVQSGTIEVWWTAGDGAWAICPNGLFVPTR